MARTVPITEEFDSGTWTNYDLIDTEAQTALDKTQHLNIRSFEAVDDLIPTTVGSQNLQSWADLNNQYVAGNQVAFNPGENWTVGVVGSDREYGRRRTLRIACVTGDNITESEDHPVDISSFADEDTFSLALPSFPATVAVANSWVELVSSDGSLVRLQMQDSATLVMVGDCEASWPLSSIPLEEIATVRLNFNVISGSPTVIVAAIRVLKNGWQAFALAQNTREQRLEQAPDRVGHLGATALPRMWRADSPTSPYDPKPINATFAVPFFTGTMTSAGDNEINLYFRERREDLLTQQDLNGAIISGSALLPSPTLLPSDGTFPGLTATTTTGYNQGQLNAIGKQPTFGQSIYDPREQEDLGDLTQTEINAFDQWELERLPDTIAESYIQVQLIWNTGLSRITLQTENSDPDLKFSFAMGALDPNTGYVLIASVEDCSVRIKLYETNEFGLLSNLVFDTTEINDDFLFKRRKGRVGWQFVLQDGDAYISAVRSQGLMYGEFQSQVWESHTPVEGARLTVGGTPDRQFYTGAKAFNGGVLTPDKENARSDDGAIMVTGTAMQGLTTNEVVFESFEQTELSFDLYIPSLAFNQGVRPVVALRSERGHFIPLQLGRLTQDQWQHFELLPIDASKEQAGRYTLCFFHTRPISASFSVDNISIRQRSVAWSARAERQDPWNQKTVRWASFGDLINRENDGILFERRGTALQVRGQALVQNANIGRLYVKPKYAELGRLVWDDFDVDFTWVVDPRPAGSRLPFTMTFTATTKGFDPSRTLYIWDFGDGYIVKTDKSALRISQTVTSAKLTVTDGQRIKTVIKAVT